MENALRYILRKRNMRQCDLTNANVKILKQSISKYINRERRMPSYIYNHFAKVLNVPHELFMDDDGRCKELSEKEIYEMDYYLTTHPLSNPIMCNNELFERDAILERETKLCLRKIKEDIYSIPSDTKIESAYMAIDEFESNLSLYETFSRLHRNNSLSYDEWHNIFRAISYFIDNTTQEEIHDGHKLSQYIYDAIIKYRKERENEAIEIIKLFYPDMLSNLDEELSNSDEDN